MDKVFLTVIPEQDWIIKDQDGMKYTPEKAKELYGKDGVLVADPIFKRLVDVDFDMEKLKENY